MSLSSYNLRQPVDADSPSLGGAKPDGLAEGETGCVGPYVLRQLLGKGGMGEVYLAEHRLLKRPCAVKLIRTDRANDPEAIARFESEVQATARLTHPNTVEIYDYGVTESGVFFYAMEFLPGSNLQELVERTGPMPAERVIHLLRQVCSALSEAHRQGMIHRDLKPGNIFAAERGGLCDYAKLLDFGLVKSTGGEQSVELSCDGLVVGSPLYAAPEIIFSGSALDARADLYSLGATAYFLLTGHPVFAGTNALQVLFAHAQQRPVPPSQLQDGIPADLEAVVLKLLAKSPSDRFASAEELEAALARCEDAGLWTRERAAAWWQSSESTAVVASVNASSLAETSLGLPLAAFEPATRRNPSGRAGNDSEKSFARLSIAERPVRLSAGGTTCDSCCSATTTRRTGKRPAKPCIRLPCRKRCSSRTSFSPRDNTCSLHLCIP